MAISHEEAVSKLVALRASAEEKAKVYNALFQEGKISDANKVREEIDELVNEYTSVVRTDCFEACKQSGDPMMKALDLMTFISIAAKDNKKGDEKTPVLEIIDRTMRIDLYKLHKYCNGIGVDHNWIYMVEQLNLQLTIRGTREIIKDAKKRDEAIAQIVKTYALSNVAREINLGKDPASNTQLLKTLNAIIAAMIGTDYKATSHDVAWLKQAYAKEGKSIGQLIAADHKSLRSKMAVLCHNITHPEMEYSMSYKQIKEK